MQVGAKSAVDKSEETVLRPYHVTIQVGFMAGAACEAEWFSFKSG